MSWLPVEPVIQLYILTKKGVRKIKNRVNNKNAATKLFQLNKETERKIDPFNGVADVITFRTLISTLQHGATNIENLGFAVYRGYIPSLINFRFVGAPYFFEKLLDKRKKIIESRVSPRTVARMCEIQQDLVMVKFTYNLVFVWRRRSVCKLVDILCHLVCADIGKFTACFIGCHGCYNKCTMRILRHCAH